MTAIRWPIVAIISPRRLNWLGVQASLANCGLSKALMDTGTRTSVACNVAGHQIAMRWSIRNQILIPLIAIQAVAVAATTLATAALAARRSERQIIDRLNGVIDTLGHANFPYTASVLAQMRGLSGAHFVAYADDGRVTETSLAGLEELPPVLRSASEGDAPRLAGRITDGPPGRHALPRGPAPVRRTVRRARRSWCSTPRRAGDRPGGRRRCRP